ncbi:hypothetical protein LMJF_29_1970 [Leishmania major strain Friedlin]|uniref:BRCT domain-containing protein n=1 Tax=Leishmania major TaxID=5664 RepID=E9AE58_LEIMA|nr:hypothetical protein LMJF_29_1970 [Leishmania major strain Friedlin]CAG9577937.1 hypothetical_protein_-_conserved [Leishmania major strain Friedlin]CBZ12537.1 hypothetical protein LMJF_29_1970 [Leishmania major strain Friedlin]|eukprot:XP_003722279.1 hypothetical protein LMJF_29_1970 [Leishmania major strain Friedlin]
MSLLSDRAVVEHQLQRQGGEVLANPTRIRSLLIAKNVSKTKLAHWVPLRESKPVYVSAKYVSAGVAHPQWLVDGVEAVAVLLWAPRHMRYGSRSCKAKLTQLLDTDEDARHDPLHGDEPTLLPLHCRACPPEGGTRACTFRC